MNDLEDQIYPICMIRVEIGQVKMFVLWSTGMIWRNPIIAIYINRVEIGQLKSWFCINMYDLEESNYWHWYQNSWNLPGGQGWFVSICIKKVDICRERKGWFCFNMYDLEESNLSHLYENSWNLQREMVGFVYTCMIWMNQIVANCMKIVEILREKWLVMYQHVWFGGIQSSPFVWK